MRTPSATGQRIVGTVNLHGLITLLLIVLAGGCASRIGTWDGPRKPAPVTVQKWTCGKIPGKCLTTPHYLVYSTVNSDDFSRQLAQLMEGALGQYHRLAPQVPLSEKPMVCFMFDKRWQWADFTRLNTGADASVYLQINRGGYTIRDWYVAYFIGDVGTLSVAAHEGWHQYVARHFKDRLPPFLEEGLACMFENVWWDDDLPKWNLSINPTRTQGLRHAIENKRLWPLGQLIAMHAGQIVNEPGDRIEAFYGQSWAFARFLWEAEKGRYRPALQKLLTDTAAGTVPDPTGTNAWKAGNWNPAAVRPMLEQYMGMDMEAIDRAYQAYIREVAFQEFSAQWGL